MSKITPSSSPQSPEVARFIASLNQAMVVAQLSQRGLGRSIDVTVGTITKYLRGDISPFDVKTGIIQKLAGVLGVSVQSLLNYYETGEYADAVTIEEVASWIQSEAGQEDMPRILHALASSQTPSSETEKEKIERTRAHLIKAYKGDFPATYKDDEAMKYGKKLSEVFYEIGLGKCLKPQDAWEQLSKTEIFKKTEKMAPGYTVLCKLVVTLQHDLTAEEMNGLLELTEGCCPCVEAFAEWTEMDMTEVKAELLALTSIPRNPSD